MSRPSVPDALAVEVPLGGRALVLSDLHLGPIATATSKAATAELAQAIDAWTGPGVVVFNGSCLELLGAGTSDACSALTAHPVLVRAVMAFASGAGRRVVFLPGARDGRAAWDPVVATTITSLLGAEIALAAELTIDTGGGPRMVRVEPGHQLDPLTLLCDPRNPAESPLGHHLVCEVLPALREATPGRGAGSRSGTGSATGTGSVSGLSSDRSPDSDRRLAMRSRSGRSPNSDRRLAMRSRSGRSPDSHRRPAMRSRSGREGWLQGLESLDDPAAFPRFLASRLTYRRMGRHAWVLVLPLVAALLLRLPFEVVRQAHQHVASAARVAVFLVLATIIGLILVGTVVALLVRGTWKGLSGVALRRASGDDRLDRNGPARARARELITAGQAGLVTGNTRRPELSYLGGGFYANSGCAAAVVSESPTRLDTLGAPSLFLAAQQVSWVELEAGSELHARLLYHRQDLPGATVLERLLVRRSPERSAAAAGERSQPVAAANVAGGRSQPVVVATFPHGSSWPAEVPLDRRLRRVRRWAAGLVAAAGVLSLMSAFLVPFRQRLSSLLHYVPLAVPQAANALVALASLGLLVLARSIRRGQRRAWLIAESLLAGTFILHLVRGFDIEEALATAAVGGYLLLNRDAFGAGVDKPSTRRALWTLAGGAMLSVAVGTAAVEMGTRLARSRHHQRMPLPRAFVAATERLVGLQTVKLPDRLDDFFAPAMVAIAIGLGLAVAYLLFRPVVARHAGPLAGGFAATGAGGASAGSSGAGTGEGTSTGAGGAEASRSGGGPGGLEAARAVVRRYGSGTLDYFALRPDKEFFFSGDSVVAYGVFGGVCLVSPDPIGPPSEGEQVWKQFSRFADEQGWTLAVMGAGEQWLPIYRAAGMHDLYMGDEAVVDCTRFTLDGGRFKGLRQAVNRVAKYGYTITFHDPSTISASLREQLEEVMTKSRRGDVERGFSMTLGRAFDPSDDGLLLAVVWGPPADGAPAAPVAFCQYVPAPGIDGFSLDLMRRDNGEHPNGLLDFAVVETIRHLRASGQRGLGLNFATMRAVLAGEAGEGLSQRIQSWLLRRMSDSMQIESLWRFNAKYDPDWQPRYALYDSPEHALPAVIAVARAESFWELPVIGRFLVPSAPAPVPPPASQTVPVPTSVSPTVPTPVAPAAVPVTLGTSNGQEAPVSQMLSANGKTGAPRTKPSGPNTGNRTAPVDHEGRAPVDKMPPERRESGSR